MFFNNAALIGISDVIQFLKAAGEFAVSIDLGLINLIACIPLVIALFLISRKIWKQKTKNLLTKGK